MDSIQLLKPGTRLELIGGVRAEVERNPRDGVWLLARSQDAASAVSRAFAESVHGAVSFREGDSPDVLLYVHADDIVALAN